MPKEFETRRADEGLDGLLALLRSEPVPDEALKDSWRKIDARLEWRRENMSPLAFSMFRSKGLAAASVAAAVLLSFAVGFVALQAQRSGLSMGGFAGSESAPAASPVMVALTRTATPGGGETGVFEEGRDANVDGDTSLGGIGYGSDVAGKTGGGRAAGGAFASRREMERWSKDDNSPRQERSRADSPAAAASPSAPPPPPAEKPYGKSRSADPRSNLEDRKKSEGIASREPLAPPDLMKMPGAADKSKEQGGQLGNAPKPGEPLPPAQAAQKIIKTADLSLEVKKFEEASREVDRLVTRFRGFYADNRVTQNDDGTTTAHIVVRVPQASFEALYAELKKLGRVKSENAKGEDVTEKYTDLSARIRNAEALEKSLLVLLDEKKKNAKMSEIIEVQRELGKVREEIEKMVGSLRVMDNLIDFGTIYLTLAERTRTVPSGTLSVEVRDALEADKGLDRIAGELGGQVASRTSSKRGDGTTMVNAVVKAPMPKFGQLIDALKGLGVRVDREEVRGYDLAAIAEDEGAKQVMASASVVLFEPSMQKPGGSARIEVETVEGAAAALAAILKTVDGSQVSRTESREGGAASATFVVRTSRARFNDLALALPMIGSVKEKQLVGADAGKVEGPAAKVACDLTLFVYERERQTPGGSVQISTTNLKDSDDKLAALIRSAEAQVQSHVENRQPGGTSSAQYQLAIRRGKFQAFVDGLVVVGRPDNKQIQGLEPGEVRGAAAEVMCTLTLNINERRAPVPSAHMEVVVKDAAEIAAKLQTQRDAAGAETVNHSTQQGADGSVVDTWILKVAVEKFDKFVADAQGLGRVRSKSVTGVQAGAEEKPDPKALADVTVTLVQFSPLRPPPEETTGSVRAIVNTAIKALFWILGCILFGLIVIVPVILIIVGLVKLVRWMVREKAPAVTVSAGTPPPEKK